MLVGLGLALGVYGVCWYLPNRAELARVNHYYLFQQLLPHNLNQVRFDVTQALFGDERGYSSYLFRHAPVQFVLTLLGLAAWVIRRGKVGRLDTFAYSAAIYLGLWLLSAWTIFAIVRYAPPRYYILFYPALTGIAALVLGHLPAVLRTVWSSRVARTLLGGFLTYHLFEAGLHHGRGATEFVLYSAALLVSCILFLLPIAVLKQESAAGEEGKQIAAVLGVWALVNTLWLGDWLTHLSYAQRDADRWLAANLPPQSVLIGDAAPGLCLNNRFVVVNVITGLCNDHHILEDFASYPRYVVLLDGPRNVGAWNKSYPDIIRSGCVKKTFPHMINFSITVFEVPPGAALPPVEKR